MQCRTNTFILAFYSLSFLMSLIELGKGAIAFSKPKTKRETSLDLDLLDKEDLYTFEFSLERQIELEEAIRDTQRRVLGGGKL